MTRNMDDDYLCLVTSGVKLSRGSGLGSKIVNGVPFAEFCMASQASDVMLRAMEETGEVSAACFPLNNAKSLAELLHLGFPVAIRSTRG